MWFLGVLASLALIILVLVDSFETTVLPRRVTHRYRFARFFYRTNWRLWRTLALWIPAGKAREAFLSVFGPLSLLALLANWVIGLIFGFTFLHWSLETPLLAPEKSVGFSTYLYWSGGTFFTLGYGEVTPGNALGRALAVIEVGMGFGFLALIISYLPVINQSFSRREVPISLLDARAGSPPSAAELLVRLARSGDISLVDSFLAEWEEWAAEVLESHLSFPALSFYRSQHDNQSWLAALTFVLDTCSLLIVAVKGNNTYRAQLAFAMARHVAVDLALVFKTRPREVDEDRLPAPKLGQLRELLRAAGVDLHEGPAVDRKLAEVRGMYEPFVNALARRLLLALPAIVPETAAADNWQKSAWMPRAPAIGTLPVVPVGDRDHF
jgi:hypothetical protein